MKAFTKFRADALKYYVAQQEARETRDTALAFNQSRFAGQLLKDENAKAIAAYDAVAGKGKDKLISDIEAVRAAKIAQLKAAVIDAPTPAQERKLGELRRRKNISKEEFELVAESMRGSYGCLAALGEIGEPFNLVVNAVAQLIDREVQF